MESELVCVDCGAAHEDFMGEVEDGCVICGGELVEVDDDEVA